ncbi:MAG: SufD family Fe-S cluster assembly protein [Bacteroidales bacterium]|nr:SufD family Fe-S cluster assembly protein [Bacteroidales bacterium]
MVSLKTEGGQHLKEVILMEEGFRQQYVVEVGASSSLDLVMVGLPGDGEISAEMDIRLEGRDAECRLNTLYLAGGNSRFNLDVNLIHNSPDSRSSQLLKGILKGEASAAYHGLIKVPQHCIGIDAQQQSHALLLEEGARVRHLPQLEIYADDVKCSHGSTVGRLNEDELFYLKSRGVSAEDAARFLQTAFAMEVLALLDQSTLDYLRNALTQWVIM